jgi:hypothetical protein
VYVAGDYDHYLCVSSRALSLSIHERVRSLKQLTFATPKELIGLVANPPAGGEFRCRFYTSSSYSYRLVRLQAAVDAAASAKTACWN